MLFFRAEKESNDFFFVIIVIRFGAFSLLLMIETVLDPILRHSLPTGHFWRPKYCLFWTDKFVKGSILWLKVEEGWEMGRRSGRMRGREDGQFVSPCYTRGSGLVLQVIWGLLHQYREGWWSHLGYLVRAVQPFNSYQTLAVMPNIWLLHNFSENQTIFG